MRSLYEKSTQILGNEKGMALVMSLVLGLIGMVMLLSLIYMVGTATWIGGAKNRYLTALASARGGMDFFTKEIVSRGLGGTSLGSMGTYGGLVSTGGFGFTSDANFLTKLTTTGSYAIATPDARFTFANPSGGPATVVDSTIGDSSLGNSGVAANVLQGGGVVNNNAGTITPQQIPYLFRTENSARSAAGTNENARLSSLYVF